MELEGDLDALVFAGGIGGKAALLQERVVKKCQCLGFEIEEKKIGMTMKDMVQDIGVDTAKHRALVCQTDEQVRSALSLKIAMTDRPLVRDG